MKEKNMINLITKELLFILAEWIIFLIAYGVFLYISDLTGLNSGIVLIGYILWMLELIIVGIKFLRHEDNICEDYNMKRLKLRLITFLTLILTNSIFAIVIFPLGNYGKIPFVIYSDYDFLLYMFMAILFIIITILVLGIGYLVKAIKSKKV